MHNSDIYGRCQQKLTELSALSDEVYQYYFPDINKGQRKPFFKLKKNVLHLYSFVYQLSSSKPSHEEKLFELFKNALTQHIAKHMALLFQRNQDPIDIIRIFNLIRESYMAYLLLLSKRIFVYLNRYYIPANDHQSLEKVGIKEFTRTFLRPDTLRVFFGAYTRDIQKIRKERAVCDNELYLFSESFALIFTDNFFSVLKDMYFAESQAFYQIIYENNCNLQPINYLNMVNNLWYFEEMVQKKTICLIYPEAQELLLLFTQKLVRQYTEKLKKHPYGFRYFLKNHKITELKIMYQVYSRCEGFEQLRKEIYQFIIQEGFAILNEKSKSSNHIDFIQSFFNYEIAYSKLINECFNRNEEMQVSLRNGIEKLASKFQKLGEILFSCTRSLMDRGQFSSHQEIIISIFEKLAYKDQYLSMYRNSLQKKIISGDIVYLIEKQFIQTVNKICGSQMTNQLDKILEDYIQSMPNDIIPENLKQENFEIKVVALHYWEKKFQNQVAMNLALCDSLKNSWNQFEQAYLTKFPKRKLIILPYQTKITLQIKVGTRTIKIKCNLIQASILLYASKVGKDQIKEEELIMQLTLQKLFLLTTLGQIPQLMVETSPGTYKFNWDFDSEQTLVDISSKIQQQTKFTKYIHQDREILIQAAIVKITKNQKQITFENLVWELERRIKLFKPHPHNIKQAVQKLIKRDMVEELPGGIIRYLQ